MATNRTGTALADQLTGNSGADSMSGLAGDDTLRGNGGNDVLNGGSGHDYLAGGSGNDVYYVDSVYDRVVESAGGGTDTVRASASYMLPEHAEKLILTGSADLDGAGNSAANTITGNGGDNTLAGNGGNDTIAGRGGDDDISGNSGADVLNGEGGDDELSGGAGADRLIGGSGDDDLSGGSGADSLSGGDGDDHLEGGAGADTLLGGLGADAFFGGAGIDTVTYAEATDGVSVSIAGFSDAGEALFDTFHGIENLIGSGFDDALVGDGLANVITGGAGHDFVHGGGGNDTLHGDADDITLDGGGGHDWLVLAGGGQVYDYSLESPLLDLDNVDLSAAGSDTLILDADAAVLAAELLFVHGTAEDAVATSDIWVLQGEILEGSKAFRSESGSFMVVDEAMDVDGIRVSISLGSLNGAFGGVKLGDAGPGNIAGFSVASAGDIDRDGLDDVIVSSAQSGESYVVFGHALSSAPALSALDGTDGFRLQGETGLDAAGFVVGSAGDVNGDGFADLFVSAPYADVGEVSVGATYVVFGTDAPFDPLVDLGLLDGGQGFRIIGDGSRSGWSVSGSGDVNGDGYDDLAISEFLGSTYVVFGHSGPHSASLALSELDGTNGFEIDAVEGTATSFAGDVNGDGYDDVIVGIPIVSDVTGETYVVFGQSAFASSVPLSALTGTPGFQLTGESDGDASGAAVSSAGDFNGDGFADFIIGALNAAPGGRYDAGASYVVFGHDGPFSGVALSTLDGSNGFQLSGVHHYSQSGTVVAAAGDVNGDGLDDVLVSTFKADGYSGETYLVFGRASGMAADFELSSLDGDEGFRIDGKTDYDRSGGSVSSGDVNGDGYSDVIIGARGADAGAGAAYVLYGGDFSGVATHAGTQDADNFLGTSGAEVMIGGRGNDTLAGEGGADVFRGGEGDDVVAIGNTDFADVDGGRGEDTLALKDGLELKLTGSGDHGISGIEVIDLTGGSNSLTLSLKDLLNLSDTSNTLTIEGDTSGSVKVDGSELWGSDDSEEGYVTYTFGAATLRVDADIDIAINAAPIP